MYDIVTIGSTTRDAFLKGNFKIVRYRKTPTGRALLLPFGEKLGIEKAYFTIGGNAANASVTFSRQGFKTALVTKIGDDAAGEEVKKRLKKEKVDTRFVSLSSLPTAFSVLLLEGGERTILSYHGAIDEFTLKNFDFSKLKSRWWYVSLPGDTYKLFGKLLTAAQRHNVSVALNPSFKHLTEGREELLKSLCCISLLVLNEGEAATLAGISFKKPEAVFKKLDKLTPGIVAVTSGPRGVTVSDGRFIYQAGIFQEKVVADRTGAGDAFGSGFVAGLMRKGETCKIKGLCAGANIEYAVRLASANATSVVERVGATEGILSKKDFASPRWQKLIIRKK